MLRIGTTVIGVEALAPAIQFWHDALDYVPREEPDEGEDFVVLVPPDGVGAALALQVSESSIQRHPRIHLDLYADDPEAEIERLLALGAERVAWDRYPHDADFTVLADPDGNRFCVIDKSGG